MIESSLIHIVHILAAGIWLGGLVFTACVVSPAFKSMAWSPAERIAVRSAVGRRYTKVARVNLGVLLLALAAEGTLQVWDTALKAEVLLWLAIVILSELHARYFAPRLARAAESHDEDARRRILRTSVSVSMANLALSLVLTVLAIG